MFRIAAVSDITTWAQDYSGKPLSSSTIYSYTRKCQLKLHCAGSLIKHCPEVPLATLGSEASATENHILETDCGQTHQYYNFFFKGMNSMSSLPKRKRAMHTITSNKSKSQAL